MQMDFNRHDVTEAFAVALGGKRRKGTVTSWHLRLV